MKINESLPNNILKQAFYSKVIAFFATLSFLLIFSLCIPLRPNFSDVEKRELAKFPSFTVTTLLSGRYFRDMDTWFSDTFPARDQLIRAHTTWKKLFGIQTKQIHGNIIEGDEIPDVPPMEE